MMQKRKLGNLEVSAKRSGLQASGKGSTDL
jgi:hypothetical protein